MLSEVNPTKMPSGVEQPPAVKPAVTAFVVNPTKMPSGVEQNNLADQGQFPSDVNPTKMPSGVEQTSTCDPTRPGQSCEPDQDAFGR